MFRKFAKADVVGVKFSRERVSSYDGYRKLSDFTFDDYITNDGYLYARVVAIASKVNKNHDGWPAQELQRAYRTFIGKPIFVDHHNHDPKRARGVIVDAEVYSQDQKTSSLDPYYSSEDVDPLHLPATHVELLLEVDANRFPKLAKAIISGDIDSVSMGADVGHTICSHCGNKAEDPSQFCRHIVSKGAFFDYKRPGGQKTSKKSYENCHKVSFFEISWVFDPAETSALAMDIRQASVNKPDLKSIVLSSSPYDYEQDDEFSTAVPGEGESLDEGLTNREGEAERVVQNRYQNLIEMGYPPELAHEIAAQEYRGEGKGIDTHELRNMIQRGAEPETAYNIVRARVAQERKMARMAKIAAEHQEPQSEMTKMPEQVDTLRQEEVCPICGSDMEDGECQLCGYTEPPEGFNNPDLEKAKDVDDQIREQKGAEPEDGQMDQGNEVQPQDVAGSSEQFQPTMSKRQRVAEWRGDPNSNEIYQGDKFVDYVDPEQYGPDPNYPDNFGSSDWEEELYETLAYSVPRGDLDAYWEDIVKAVKQAVGGGSHLSKRHAKYAHVTIDTTDPSAVKVGSVQPKTVTRINTQEIPLLPITRQNSDRPLAVRTLKNPGTPTESKTNTLANKIKTADGASPHGTGTDADKRVDVEGVGAVTGDPLSGIKSESLEKDTGDFTAPHTDTWSGGEGDSLGQHDAVGGDTPDFGPIGTAVSSVKTSCDGKCKDDDDCDFCNKRKSHTIKRHGQQWHIVQRGTGKVVASFDKKAEATGWPAGIAAPGFPDHQPAHVDLQGPLAEEVGDRTRTDSHEEFRSRKVQNPVTNEAGGQAGPIGEPATSPKESRSFGFAVKAMKLAETETALGTVANKWERLAELEDKSEEYIDAQLEALAKVRTAATKQRQSRTAATRMPSLRPVTASERVEVADGDTGDSLSW